MKNLLAGFLFAALWSSGSVAIKLGLKVSQPLVLTFTRFGIATLLILGISLLINKDRLPQKKEWFPLFICGLLSIAIYPAMFVFAMQHITPGIGTLSSALAPLMISLLNAVWLQQKITWNIWVGLLIGLTGVFISIYPLLLNAHATPLGVVLISSCMICYSVGAVYYQSINWTLPRLSINGWQVFFGSLLLLPFMLYFFDGSKNNFDHSTFWFSTLWLVIPISIIAVQFWLYLLKAEPTKASLWLFLCPIFGFLYAAILTNEPITIFTVVGTIFVLLGLYLGKK